MRGRERKDFRELSQHGDQRRTSRWVRVISVAAVVLAAIYFTAGRLSLPVDRTAHTASLPPPSAPLLLASPESAASPWVPSSGEERLSGLQRLLDQEAAQIDGVAHIHVRLAGGGEAGVRAEEPINAASLIKVPVMVALYEAWESGALRRTRADEHRLRLMITHSKNIVTNQLIDELGMARINACLVRLGYHQIRLRSHILVPEPEGPNEVTAAEITRLFGQIERRELISRRAGDEMRRLLLAQHWRERIPADLPSDVMVGNKTGTLDGVLHDAAFVEAPGGLQYTLAVLVERPDRTACKSEVIAQLRRRIYDYLSATAPRLVSK